MTQDPYILANPPKREPVSDHRAYMINIQTTITGVSESVNSSLAYNLGINYSNHFFTLSKSNVVVDGKAIPNKINELYLKSTAPLHTVDFKCDKQGEIKELHKYSRLLKTWQKTKREVKQQFTGEPVTQLIQQLDKSYNNKQALMQRLSTNIVLQTFYRSFLTDYLVYYGQSNTTFKNTGVLNNIVLPFTGMKTLGLKDKKLHVQTDVKLNKSKINIVQLEAYFKNKIESFNLDDLEVHIQDRTLLDYDSVWINQSTVTKTVQIDSYKKEVVLTLQHA